MNVNIPPTPPNPANKHKDNKQTAEEKNEDSTQPLNSIDTKNMIVIWGYYSQYKEKMFQTTNQ